MILFPEVFLQEILRIKVEAEPILQFNRSTVRLKEDDHNVHKVLREILGRARFCQCWRLHEVGNDALNRVNDEHDLDRVIVNVRVLGVRRKRRNHIG